MTASTRTPLAAHGRADRRTPLADVWRDAILATYKQVIAPDPRTRPAADRYVSENGRAMLPRNAGMAATSAAYLALTPFAGNVYHGREDMLAFAFAAAERLVFDHAGTGITQLKPSHFFLYPLATLYELAGSHAGRQRRQIWRETMGRNLRAVGNLLDRTWDDLGRTLPWAGTGPNHFPGWMAVGYHQARILEDDAMMRRIEAGMARQLRVQAPGGYFPEHIGPVMVYHHISLNGFAEFHRLRPSAATRRAVERGADFLVHALYPDLRCIETFDERNRLGYMPDYSAGLAWTPLGRALMRRMVERLRPHRQLEKFHWDHLGGAFRCFEHVLAAEAVGEAPVLPNERPRLTWKLEDRGLVRKEGPWFYAMSAWVHPPLIGNPYVLERTQLLSIHHARTGLIVGGGNDLRSPHAASVHVVEEREVHFPPIAGALACARTPRALTGRGRCDRIELDFGCARAWLEVLVAGPRRLDIALRAESNMINHEIALVLQLQLKASARLTTDRRRLKLATVQPQQSATALPLGRTLAAAGAWRFKLPPGATLNWPHLPWNSYAPPTYRAAPEMATALLRVPIDLRSGRCALSLEILGA